MEKQCRTCGKTFKPSPANSVFCSHTCRIAWKAAHAPPMPITSRACAWCGKEFPINDARGRHAKFCSTKCRNADYRKKLEGSYTHNKAYNLRFSIMARDGFRCRYCGRSPQQDGVKLVVDHIIPKDKGGTDDPSNLITACQDCNIGKGSLLLLASKGQIPSYLAIESLTQFPPKK